MGCDSIVLDALYEIGRAERDLVRIVLTHWHHDHTGGLARLAERTGATVCAGRADAPVIRGDASGDPPVLTPAEEPLMAQIDGQVAVAPACRVDVELGDGDMLGGSPAAVVLAMPGHTPGSVAVYLSGERVVLTGDIAANSEGHVILGPFNTDREQAVTSLGRLTDLDVDAVGFGHGAPIVGGAASALVAWTDPLGPTQRGRRS